MKMEIKHLSPYLPYGLKMTKEDWGKTGILVPWVTFKEGLQIELDYAITTQAKPILRPLSDLTKEIEHKGEFIIPILSLDFTPVEVYEDSECWLRDLCYEDFIKLIEWHFDVFGLIEKGLALSYNDL